MNSANPIKIDKKHCSNIEKRDIYKTTSMFVMVFSGKQHRRLSDNCINNCNHSRTMAPHLCGSRCAYLMYFVQKTYYYRGGGQLTPQFGQIYDIHSGKRQDIYLTNCVTPNGTSIHLPEIHFGWGNTGDVHRVILYDRQK